MKSSFDTKPIEGRRQLIPHLFHFLIIQPSATSALSKDVTPLYNCRDEGFVLLGLGLDLDHFPD